MKMIETMGIMCMVLLIIAVVIVLVIFGNKYCNENRPVESFCSSNCSYHIGLASGHGGNGETLHLRKNEDGTFTIIKITKGN